MEDKTVGADFQKWTILPNLSTLTGRWESRWESWRWPYFYHTLYGRVSPKKASTQKFCNGNWGNASKNFFFKGYLLYCILFFSILSLIIVDHCVSLSSLGEEVWEGGAWKSVPAFLHDRDGGLVARIQEGCHFQSSHCHPLPGELSHQYLLQNPTKRGLLWPCCTTSPPTSSGSSWRFSSFRCSSWSPSSMSIGATAGNAIRR